MSFLEDKDKYGRVAAHIPKRILLVGPPGTSRTFLARVVAGEADVPFFSISGSEFVEMFVRVGAAHVRDLIEEAYQRAKTILEGDLSNLKAGAALSLEKETVTPADFAPLSRGATSKKQLGTQMHRAI